MDSKPKSYTIGTSTFCTGERYQVHKIIGAGAYGQVVLATDHRTQSKVAIKKLHQIEDSIDAKRVLREIRIIRYLKHENILEMLNIIYDDSNADQEFGDVYLVTNLMEIDLYKVIKSGQELTDAHVQSILHQILKGLKYLHSANVIHRDIKPSNILATTDCQIRMCDFGLSRQIEDEESFEQSKGVSQLTEYVVTRYYRAPEIMLSSHQYSKAVDMWSLGCTFAEMLTKQILFKADNYIKQIQVIFDTLGQPAEEELGFITNQNAQKYVDSLPQKNPIHCKEFVTYENPQAVDLLNQMLTINPAQRLTAEEALAHPYLKDLHDKKEEPQFENSIDFSFENDQKYSLNDLRSLILEQVNYYQKANEEPLIDITQAMKLVDERKGQISEQVKDVVANAK